VSRQCPALLQCRWRKCNSSSRTPIRNVPPRVETAASLLLRQPSIVSPPRVEPPHFFAAAASSLIFFCKIVSRLLLFLRRASIVSHLRGLTRAFAVPWSACLWFRLYLGSVPLREGYLDVFGFLILCVTRSHIRTPHVEEKDSTRGSWVGSRRRTRCGAPCATGCVGTSSSTLNRQVSKLINRRGSRSLWRPILTGHLEKLVADFSKAQRRFCQIDGFVDSREVVHPKEVEIE
jgi:hypothetical protein